MVGATMVGVIWGGDELEKVVMVEASEEATEDAVEATEEISGGVEHTGKRGDGKTAPFLNGRGRVGLAADPTAFPLPGNFGAVTAEPAFTAAAAAAAPAAARAAWCWAALCLSRARLAGPRRRTACWRCC